MNQRPTGLNVIKAMTGFLQYKSAEVLLPVTVTGYEHDLKLWIDHHGDMDVGAVETTHILAYLNYLRTDYVPRRITGNNDKKLSPKTVYNLYISVASFFTWALAEFKMNNPMKSVPAPKFKIPDVEPFAQEETEWMLSACTYSREADTIFRKKFAMRRPTANRDQTICKRPGQRKFDRKEWATFMREPKSS